MTIYAYVEENQIKEIHNSLPQNWKNISGFYHLANEPQTLKLHGWYIINENIPEYDTTKYYLSEPSYVFENDNVVANYTLNEIVIQQGEPATELQRRFMILLREDRNQRLRASDWSMMTDLVKLKSEQWVSSWELYRKQLRDLPDQYIFSETDLPPGMETIPWPQQPEN
jgi:hypothetical protein